MITIIHRSKGITYARAARASAVIMAASAAATKEVGDSDTTLPLTITLCTVPATWHLNLTNGLAKPSLQVRWAGCIRIPASARDRSASGR